MATLDKDLIAIQSILDTLSAFEEDDQKRIISFVCLKLKINTDYEGGSFAAPGMTGIRRTYSPQSLKLFLKDKKKLSDVRFAVAVAYYYKYVAPDEQKKDEIVFTDVELGSDSVSRARPEGGGHALRDAKAASFLKIGSKRGSYMLDLAGEELIQDIIAKSSESNLANTSTE